MNILVTGANGQLGNEMRRVSSTSSNQYIFTDVGELDKPVVILSVKWSMTTKFMSSLIVLPIPM